MSRRTWWGPAGPLDTWQAMTAAPTRSRFLCASRTLFPRDVCDRSGCGPTIGRAEPLPPTDRSDPYPKDGLAVAPPQQVARIDILGAASPEWTAFRPLVTDGFNKTERSIARRKRPPGHHRERARGHESQHRSDLRLRQRSSNVLRRSGAASIRSIRKRTSCRAVAFGHVWLSRDSRRPSKLLRDNRRCHEAAIATRRSYMLPLGVIAARGPCVLDRAVRGHGTRSATMLSRSTPAGEVVSAGRFGGGC